MSTEPGKLDDDELLRRSAEVRHAALLGDRASRHRALKLEREVRKRFTEFEPTVPDGGTLERPARLRLWARIKNWIKG